MQNLKILKDSDISFFKKQGFIVIKKLLDDKEIKKFENIYDDNKESISDQFFAFKNENCWEYLKNKKLNLIIQDLIGPKIYHMHDLQFAEHQIDLKGGSWHRDSPCRRTGIGPDWDINFPYNVITSITYLCDSYSTKSVLNVLPKSHNLNYKYSLSNFFRFFHNKNKKKELSNRLFKYINIINGKRLKYEKGDCIFFYSNLYHMGENLSSDLKSTRRLIVSRYGGPGKHSENYLNYHLFHRLDQIGKYRESEKAQKFFSFLKENKLFVEIPKSKKEITGSFSTS